MPLKLLPGGDPLGLSDDARNVVNRETALLPTADLLLFVRNGKVVKVVCWVLQYRFVHRSTRLRDAESKRIPEVSYKPLG